MILSRPFLAGLAILIGVETLHPRLPAPVEPFRLAACALLLPLPAVLARISGQRIVQRSLHGLPLGVGLRLAAAAERIAVPVLFGLLLVWAGFLDLADALAPESETLHTAVVLAPLLALDLSVRGVELRTERWLELRGFAPRSVLIRSRARTSILIVVALSAISAAVDLVALSRTLEVWLTTTSVGTTLSLLAAIGGLALVLPAGLLLALPTDRRLPRAWEQPIRDICTQLDFPFRGVRVLRTGRRMITAALVGTFRPARFLLLTDGILATLDPFAIRGVIAHEIAHLRGHHIALKLLAFAVVPLLVLQPLLDLEHSALTPAGWLVVLAGGAASGWLLMRLFMLRLEYEADLGAAELLGHAEPTIAALRRIADILPGSTSWVPSFHPQDERRVARLLRWEREPEYRRRFARRGRLLRRGLLLMLLAALSWNVSAHAASWPLDRARAAFLVGDFAHAERRLAALREAGTADAEVARLSALTDAAIELVGAGGPWERLRDELAARAWPRAIETLADDGAVAALPWATLATAAGAPGPVRRSVHELCAAAADGDLYAVQRVAEHLRALDATPEAVRDALDAAIGATTTLPGGARPARDQ